MDRGDWLLEAACRGLPPESFTPDLASNQSIKRNTTQAVRVCANCPVVQECAQYALEQVTGNRKWGPFGVWAGIPFRADPKDAPLEEKLRTIAYPDMEQTA